MKEYTLPNGKKVFHNNDRETEFLYEEIFLDKVYTSCGIKLKKDSVVLDVGANIGLFSVFVLENFSESKVYSFEPSPQIFKILKSNVSPYEGRCKTFKTGISDVEGEEEFLFYPDYSTFSTFYPDKMNTDKDRMENVVDAKTAERALIPVKEKCSLLTLSHIIKSEKIDHIDLLKMDVQRAELNVLKGIEKDDWVKIKQISFELHHIGEEETKEIETLLSEKGYRVVKEKDKLFTPEVPVYMVYAFRT